MNISAKRIMLVIGFLAFLPLAAAAEDLAVQCQQLSQNKDSCQNLSTAECQTELKKCAAYYDQQSAQIAQDITKTAAQKTTLNNAVNTLKKKITGLEYQIKQGTLMVKDLGLQINDTEVSIKATENKIDDSKGQIAAILRSIYEEDQKPSFQILLEGDLTDFFGNVVYLENLDAKVSSLLENTQSLGNYLENQKAKMDDEKSSLEKTIKVQSSLKAQNEQNKKEQDGYLKLTEAQYQQQIRDKATADKNAASIKARIFEVVGVSAAPNFGQAVEIAKYVSGITGVRPALLLAILTQESNLGKNVGQCYVTDLATGNGTSLQGAPRSRVMSPKTIPTFVALTESLGMPTTKTQVSCWIPLYSGGVPYGWGGAMGPAQFIASTWSLYENRVTQIKGSRANPWNIKDAFLASGLLLKDNGALSNESAAASRYYCGSNIGRYECKNYANSVLRYASQYEADIKAIGG